MKSSEIAALSPHDRNQLKVRERMRGLGEVDILKLWYESPEPFDLTPKEEEIKQRWEYAKLRFMKSRNYSQITQDLQTEFSICERQATHDIRHMKYVFGDVDIVTKAAHKQRAIKMALDSYKVAKKGGYPDAMVKATKAYMTATGVDRDDIEPLDIGKVMADKNYIEVLDPQIRSLLLNLLNQTGGVIDTTKLFEAAYTAKNAEDFTDFEEVPQQAPEDDDK